MGGDHGNELVSSLSECTNLIGLVWAHTMNRKIRTLGIIPVLES